tara:strand:- start:209 stop:2968 length:2760 start_codon:yes stop_codon:yes gene_type:complete
MNSQEIYNLFLSKFRDEYNATFFQAIENPNAPTRLLANKNPNTIFDQQIKKAVVARIDQEIKNADGRSASQIANALINDMAPFIKRRNEALENRDKAETNKFGLTTSNATFDVARHKKGNQDNTAAMVSDVQAQANAFINTILPAKDFGSKAPTSRATQAAEGSVAAEEDLASMRGAQNKRDEEAAAAAHRRQNPDMYFSQSRRFNGVSYAKGDRKPDEYLRQFGSRGNPQQGFSGRVPQETQASFAAQQSTQDSGAAGDSGPTNAQIKAQLDNDFGVGNWTQLPSIAAFGGGAYLSIRDEETGDTYTYDWFGDSGLLVIDPKSRDSQIKAEMEAEIAASAPTTQSRISGNEIALDSDEKLYYWDPDIRGFMVETETGSGVFEKGRPNLTIEEQPAASTSQFRGDYLTDTQVIDGKETPVWYNEDNARWETGYPPEGRQQLTTYTTASGEDILIDEEGNYAGSLGISRDHIVSQRDFNEGVRQFDVAESGRNDRFYAGLTEDARQFDTRFGEDVRQFDLGFGENVRQFDLGFGEDQRQFNETMAANNYFNTLEELGRNYRTLIQTSPQLANAATQQGELIRNILTQGGDVLARTFFTRGGQSPLPEITMADLINNVYEEAHQIKMFERQAIEDENMRRMVADMQQGKPAFDAYVAGEMAKPPPQTRQDFFDETAFNVAMTDWEAGDWTSPDHSAKIAELSGKLAAAEAGWEAERAQINADRAAVQGSDLQGQDYLDEIWAVNAANNQLTAEMNATRNEINSQIGQLQSEMYPLQKPTRDQFTTSTFIEGQRPIMGFDEWWGQNQGQFPSSPMLNVPDVPQPNFTTQEQLIAQARATTPPAVQSVLSGQMPSPLQFGGLPLPTFQQLQALTPDEQQMLNTRLMTEFNVPLSDIAFQSQRQFSAPSMDRNRDLARFRGYSV